MPRMIDMIRTSSVPSNLMQFAARGALSVPPAEMIEILVHLALHNKVFAEKARMTLAGWDEVASRAAVADPTTPKEVLDYFIKPENLRPALFPVLLDNPSISEEVLVKLAASGSAEVIRAMSESTRVTHSKAILTALRSNLNLTAAQSSAIEQKLAAFAQPVGTPEAPAVGTILLDTGDPDSQEVPDEVVHAFMAEHATELAAEANKPFELAADAHNENIPAAEKPLAEAAHAAAGGAPSAPAADQHPGPHAPQKKSFLSAGHEKGSALQKIAKLDVKGRIQLAMKGNKEERSLLIRDGTKLVAIAVLESPKVTDGEVEKFAAQKNVLEAVLRAIPMKRRFMKQYPIVRNLASNPRCPIDVSLGLMKHLLIQDLKNLAGNKDVSETVRKLALKMFKQKLDVTKK
jgi:hypothetical protein